MSRYRPSDLTFTQQQAVLTAFETGGQRDVLYSLFQMRTVRALHRKRLVSRVTLHFKEGNYEWWALSPDGRQMREDLQNYLEKRKANRR
jgi:hypothetical protein